MDSSRTKCTKCGCSWEVHLHINFKQVMKPKKFRNKQYEASLQKEQDGMALKQKMIAECEREMRENLQEQGTIKKVSIMFAVYLKLNAILPYDDVFEAYVKICIANEEMCVRADKNRDTTKLDNLKRSLAEYRQERDTIVAAIDAGDKTVKVVSLADIAAARQQLFKLERYGAQLKELYDATLAGYERYKGEKAEMREPKIWTEDGRKK
ncbi:aaa atpase domain containing protein [Aphelenchoides avenae]|nr:aaa atpase domain containing protein [Aphelenchus avenae]